MKEVFVVSNGELPVNGVYKDIPHICGHGVIEDGQDPLRVGVQIAFDCEDDETLTNAIKDYTDDGYLSQCNDNMWVLVDGYANNPRTYTIQVVEL